MSIRLTESRLRQIIHEEARNLFREKSKKINEVASRGVTKYSDIDAKQKGATHYFDYAADIGEGPISWLTQQKEGPGEDIAKELVKVMPVLRGVLIPGEDFVVIATTSSDMMYTDDQEPIDLRFYGKPDKLGMIAQTLDEEYTDQQVTIMKIK